jgi:carboxylate-amine ligase
MDIVFRPSPAPTVGIEIELALVDASTMALSSSVEDVMARVPSDLAWCIKPELMQCYIEICSGVSGSIAEAEKDLHAKVIAAEAIADELGLRLYWTGAHPFSRWHEQKVTRNERYEKLIERLQDMARQLVTFGLHVHVGLDSGGKAIMICDRIMRHLPTLLALSSNSPWWDGRVSGLRSHRSKIMEGLPTAGLPPALRNWSEFVWLMNHLIRTGFVQSVRDIWWDVRPHYNFGTIEVRVCDMPGNLDDALAIAALVHCLVKALSDEIDRGTYQHDHHPMIVRQNKWRAARYGLDAPLVDSFTYELSSARDEVRNLVERLRPAAVELGAAPYLERAAKLASGPTWADRQLALLEETRDPSEVVRRMTSASRLSAEVPRSQASGAAEKHRSHPAS